MVQARVGSFVRRGARCLSCTGCTGTYVRICSVLVLPLRVRWGAHSLSRSMLPLLVRWNINCFSRTLHGSLTSFLRSGTGQPSKVVTLMRLWLVSSLKEFALVGSVK